MKLVLNFVRQGGFMSLKWIFILLLTVYTIDVFSSVDNFNEILADGTKNQNQSANDLKQSLEVKTEKTLRNLTEYETVALKGFNLKIY